MKKFYMLILFICSLIMLSGCVNSNIYTEAEHYERVKELLEKRYFGDDSIYESYELYPVYNEKDKLEYFVIDFEPEGYVFVKITNSTISYSMYRRDEGSPWRKFQYKYDKKEKKYVKIYETDEEGNEIYYNNSPFKIANIKDEKRYLLKVNGNENYIPAIKTDNKYLNLVSMKEFYYKTGLSSDNIEGISLSFIVKSYFDL